MIRNGGQPGPTSRLAAGAGMLRDDAIVVAFLALFVVLGFASPPFLTWINLLNTLESGSIYGIVAIGLTILLIAGEFDLAAGAVFVFAGIVAASLQPTLGTWPSLAVARQVAALELELAARGPVHGAQHLQQRGLAGAGRPLDGEELALVDGQIHAGQGVHLLAPPPVVLGHFCQFVEHGVPIIESRQSVSGAPPEPRS